MDIKEKIYRTLLDCTNNRRILNNSIKIVDELECYIGNNAQYSIAIDTNNNLYFVCREVVFGKQRTNIFKIFTNIDELMEFCNEEE